MKLIILLAVVAWSNGAKLDKTYLPPSSAQTSGGSGSFLETPISGPSSNDYQRNDFAQNSRGPVRNQFSQRGNDFAQSGNDFQARNGVAHNGNGFNQARNNFAQDGNNYAQNGNDFAQNGNYAPSGNGFGNFEGRPERAQAAFERNAAILRQDSQNDGETYAYAYETENGIIAEENGVATNGVEAQGGFSYTGDDGQVYSIRYTADQNGFVPQGDHLPTAPPIPEEILKALEQNARDEAAGIYDDGSYNEAKYGDNSNNYNSIGNNFNSNGNAFNDANIGDDEDTVVTNNALFRTSGNQPDFRNQGPRGSTYNQDFRNQQSGLGNREGPAYRGAGLRNQAGQGSTGNQNAGASNAYLPPFASQRGQSNGRRPQSFSPRNGY